MQDLNFLADMPRQFTIALIVSGFSSSVLRYSFSITIINKPVAVTETTNVEVSQKNFIQSDFLIFQHMLKNNILRVSI